MVIACLLMVYVHVGENKMVLLNVIKNPGFEEGTYTGYSTDVPTHWYRTTVGPAWDGILSWAQLSDPNTPPPTGPTGYGYYDINVYGYGQYGYNQTTIDSISQDFTSISDINSLDFDYNGFHMGQFIVKIDGVEVGNIPPEDWSWDTSLRHKTINFATPLSPGNHTLTFDAIITSGPDDVGCYFAISFDNVVMNQEIFAPIVEFSGTPTIGSKPLTVNFTDYSTNVPSGWAWYFGDEAYNGSWVRQTASAGWSSRIEPRLVTLKNGSLLLFGGSNYDTGPLNDTWISSNLGASWTQQGGVPGWAARSGFASVVLPDGSIVLMGGWPGGPVLNDVWRSTNQGVTWVQQKANDANYWSGRSNLAAVSLSNGKIVIMGGRAAGNVLKNDVWNSVDNGVTWTKIVENASWSARHRMGAVVLSDDSIVLIGGYSGTYTTDVWRSTDGGTTWVQMKANGTPGLTVGSVNSNNIAVLPNDAIVVMGGYSGGYKKDSWISKDMGATWTQLQDPAWSSRDGFASATGVDGSIIIVGGEDNDENYLNEVWRLETAGAYSSNPSHIYSSVGKYSVALQSYNIVGDDSIIKTDYITVNAPPSGYPTISTYQGRQGIGIAVPGGVIPWGPQT